MHEKNFLCRKQFYAEFRLVTVEQINNPDPEHPRFCRNIKILFFLQTFVELSMNTEKDQKKS
jgi:hypothetical protein